MNENKRAELEATAYALKVIIARGKLALDDFAVLGNAATLLRRLASQDQQPPPAAGWDEEAVARALHAVDCSEADRGRALDGLSPIDKWADPWSPSGKHQLNALMRQAKVFIESIRTTPAATKSADATDIADAIVYSVGISLGAHHVSLDQYYEQPTKLASPHSGADAGVRETLSEIIGLLDKMAALHPSRDFREVLPDPKGLATRARLILSAHPHASDCDKQDKACGD